MTSSEQSLSQDTIFDILSSSRRRYVLYYLRQAEGPVELTALADHVAAWENQTEIENLTDREKKRVYVSIYQTHIPKLDQAGVVSWDRDTGTVSLSDEAYRIEDYLHEPSQQIAWYKVFLAYAAVSFILLALVVANVGIFGAIPEVIAAMVVVGFLAISAIQYLYYRRRKKAIPVELSQRR